MFSRGFISAVLDTRFWALHAALLEAKAALEAARQALRKASPDDPKHPGWPAGASDSRGGQFRPKDANEVEVSSDVWVRPKPRRRVSGGPRDAALSDAAKRAVRMLAVAGLRALNIEAPGLGLMLEIGLDLAERAYPYVRAYFDPPQTLDALQEAALDSQTGYDVHHIVEGATARDASEATRCGFRRSRPCIPI